MLITNTSGISLPLAVWSVDDDYDFINEKNYISVTTMMKPIRQIILAPRIPSHLKQNDVEDFIASSLGHAIHDSVEKAWHKYEQNMKKLGYPDEVIARVTINPDPEKASKNPDMIPVYLEQRIFTEFMGMKIGGKFDFVAEGVVEDLKSTSAYSWTSGSRDEDYILQMSLYRWIDSKQPFPRITQDYGRIHYVFTDWAKYQARSNPNYPQKRVLSKEYKLMSLEETEAWVKRRIITINEYSNASEGMIPHCTDKELWRSEPVYKYFSDPSKTQGRATKNFDTLREANLFLAEKGKGIVITKPGEPKRCDYCPVYPICTQKDSFK